MDDVQALVEAIYRSAAELDPPLAIVEDPDGMRERRLWATGIADRLKVEEAEYAVDLDIGSLPKDVVALRVGYHSLLIGKLGESPDWLSVGDELRRYQNQAAIAWSWLGHEGDDLLLFLVGPAGSDGDKRWEPVQREIERNEQICRKLVWLPPREEAERSASLADFLNRTFLLLPWRRYGAASQRSLDRWALLAKRLASDGFSEDAAKRWLEILSRDDVKDAERARALIEALGTNTVEHGL
jgi:hypothetical protein